ATPRTDVNCCIDEIVAAQTGPAAGRAPKAATSFLVADRICELARGFDPIASRPKLLAGGIEAVGLPPRRALMIGGLEDDRPAAEPADIDRQIAQRAVELLAITGEAALRQRCNCDLSVHPTGNVVAGEVGRFHTDGFGGAPDLGD